MRGMAISPAQVEYLVAVRDYRPKAFALGFLFARTGSFHWLQLEILRVAYEKDWEPVFQTVRAPLAEFHGADGSKRYDSSRLSAVRLRFDRTAMSVICISGMGFGKR